MAIYPLAGNLVIAFVSSPSEMRRSDSINV
jgi:hypothetical protein